MKTKLLFLLISLLGLFSCNENKPNANTNSNSYDTVLKNANNDSRSWLTHGLNYNENRFSQLNQINASNVKDLALAWSFDLAEMKGVEATPIIANGVMYVTGPWSKLYALDAATGTKKWEYDPQVPPETLEKACCDAVNRGVAIYENKIFWGTLDGRLMAVNAQTGEKIWEVMTVDKSKPYTVTGAPRVIKGKVLIGNGGAEYGVRGYLTAYDAQTGKQAWRFYSVPGDPSLGFENKAMEMAAKTWTGEWWKSGGGGTMWDAMAYDPELNLMYVGTGNGSPWNQHFRSPNGGDNLFLSCIVALNPDNGEYVWHYQTTPGDNWDYTATQQLILADLTIAGTPRKVIMQAPKNGFFYVIDRTDGKFISGEPFVKMNWATGIDYKTGRPIQTPESRYADKPYEAVPGPFGAHNWQSMAYNLNTGLVYIPAQTKPITMMTDDKYQYNKVTESAAMATGTGWNTGTVFTGGKDKYPTFGKLLAWNPITQKAAWEVPYIAPWNGGVLTTSGNLVFQGTSDGRFVAYNAETGAKLWEIPTGTGVIAAPVSYEVNGTQYISVAAGWGGAVGSTNRWSSSQITGKVYTFKIGGKEKMPDFPKRPEQVLVSGVTTKVDAAGIQQGMKLFMNNCFVCHSMPAVEKGGAFPNLGYSHKDVIQNLEVYVLEGAALKQGMPNFKGRLVQDDVEKIKAFIQSMADQVAKSKK
jgi:quinohemoprotein ethanol dehydrogenase